MTITVRRLRAERQTIVDVTGALDAAAVRPLRRALARALRMRAPVLVDLTRATSLSRPALATLALLAFLTNWNDFLWPLYVLFSPERLTLQPGLSTLQSAFSTNYATIMVGGVIASVPVLIMYIIAQRFVIEGVSRSGLKG